VGAGEHPDVDADRALFADGTDLAFLQDAEELGLQGGVQLADLIEEQRAQVGLAEEPGPGALRPGEGALAVAEELGLGEIGRERGAVEAYERLPGARRALDLGRGRRLGSARRVVRATVSPSVHDIDDKLLDREEPPHERKAMPLAGRQLKLF
jgi:hypothetical protein